MIDALKTLQKDAWRTSSARYNAARRLRRRELFATVSLALMSALTVAMAFLQKVYAAPLMPADNYLSTVSAALGIFLLTVSLVEWGTRTGAVADALHKNAENLNGFWRRVALLVAANNTTPQTLSQVQVLQAEYEALKAECPHNHLPIDDLFFLANHRGAPELPSLNRLQCALAWGRWQIASVWYIAGIWLLLVAMLLPLCDKTMWKKDSPTPGVNVGTAGPATSAPGVPGKQ